MLASLLLLLVVASSSLARAAVPCNETHNPCEEKLWKGSECKDGHCTNPFIGGCLGPLLESEEYEQKYSDGLQAMRRRLLSSNRVCNSEDASDAAARGICAENVNNYQEVRIWPQNWESGFAIAWILQIIYSELLGVPSTIETGMADKNLNFYDETNSFGYGKANEFDFFRRAFEAKGDCTVYQSANADASRDEDYIPCAHMVADIWGVNNNYYESRKLGYAGSLQFVGLIGFQGWHTTQTTLTRDPSLATYFGFAGEENREKLAKTFKRPTTWKDYCTKVSQSNCTIPDDVATRPPAEDGSEDGRYFSSGFYTGHFRATDKNDCAKTPKCTGHIVDYPCGWTSFVKQQTYHLNVALENDGHEGSGSYTYGELVDIWFAANATKSDVIGVWWTPDSVPNMLKGSGSDLIPVVLPAITQECLDNRIETSMRCNANATEFDIYGSKEGSCGTDNIFTTKAAVANMQEAIDGLVSPMSRMSPAYDLYREFSITALQIDEILTEWVGRKKDMYNFDLRLATCKWMADNIDHIMENFIPDSHPRAFIQASSTKTDAMTIVAILFSAIAIAAVVSTTGGILYLQKKGTLRRSGQIEFLLLLLAGLFFVSIGSFLMAMEPRDGTCISAIWMINVGYSTQLVPTLIRVSTIIAIVRASKKMRIVKVDRKKLLTRSIGISALAAVYCAFWTAFDPPQSKMSLELTQDTNEFGETIVYVSHYCDSQSSIWFLIMFVSQGFLLLCASLLAYQMRSVPNKVNDSKPLAVMIYSSFIFLVLRLVVYVVAGTSTGESIANATLQKARSLFCSIDAVANVIIFFPRFFRREKENKRNSTTYSDSVPQLPVSSTAGGEMSALDLSTPDEGKCTIDLTPNTNESPEDGILHTQKLVKIALPDDLPIGHALHRPSNFSACSAGSGLDNNFRDNSTVRTQRLSESMRDESDAQRLSESMRDESESYFSCESSRISSSTIENAVAQRVRLVQTNADATADSSEWDLPKWVFEEYGSKVVRKHES